MMSGSASGIMVPVLANAKKNDWLQLKHNFMEPSLGRWNITKGRNKRMAVALLV
jgi:hypothetical protein